MGLMTAIGCNCGAPDHAGPPPARSFYTTYTVVLTGRPRNHSGANIDTEMGRQNPNTDAFAQSSTPNRQQSQASQTSSRWAIKISGSAVSPLSGKPDPLPIRRRHPLRTASPQCRPAAYAEALATKISRSGADSPSCHRAIHRGQRCKTPQGTTCPSRPNVPPVREDRWSAPGSIFAASNLIDTALACVLRVQTTLGKTHKHLPDLPSSQAHLMTAWC